MPTFQSESEDNESWSVDDGSMGFDIEEVAETEQQKEENVGVEVEDDEVASKKSGSNGNMWSQASGNGRKNAQAMSDSAFQIQKVTEGVSSVGDKGVARQTRKMEKSTNKSAGKKRGPKEGSETKQPGGPNVQECSPSCVASFNLGLGQKSV
ncbi:hypothetical protein SLA2020_109980 [Shorea laevis]